MYVYPQVHFFLLINTLLISLLSVSLWQFISTKPKGQGLVTGHWPWWSSGQDSVLSLLPPAFNLWPQTEILLQATAGKGHQRSDSKKYISYLFHYFEYFLSYFEFSLKYLMQSTSFQSWVSSTDTTFSIWWYYYMLHSLWSQNSLRATRIKEISFFPVFQLET